MPKVKLCHHGQGFERCPGANRVTRARTKVFPHPNPRLRNTRTVEWAWCRWCRKYTSFELVEEK